MTMRDDQGTTTRSSGGQTPASEHDDPKLVVEALRLSEQRLRLALDAAQMGLWDVDLATGVRSESDTMGPLFGRAVGHVNPNLEAWRQQIHPADVERISREFQE